MGNKESSPKPVSAPFEICTNTSHNDSFPTNENVAISSSSPNAVMKCDNKRKDKHEDINSKKSINLLLNNMEIPQPDVYIPSPHISESNNIKMSNTFHVSAASNNASINSSDIFLDANATFTEDSSAAATTFDITNSFLPRNLNLSEFLSDTDSPNVLTVQAKISAPQNEIPEFEQDKNNNVPLKIVKNVMANELNIIEHIENATKSEQNIEDVRNTTKSEQNIENVKNTTESEQIIENVKNTTESEQNIQNVTESVHHQVKMPTKENSEKQRKSINLLNNMEIPQPDVCIPSPHISERVNDNIKTFNTLHVSAASNNASINSSDIFLDANATFTEDSSAAATTFDITNSFLPQNLNSSEFLSDTDSPNALTVQAKISAPQNEIPEFVNGQDKNNNVPLKNVMANELNIIEHIENATKSEQNIENVKNTTESEQNIQNATESVHHQVKMPIKENSGKQSFTMCPAVEISLELQKPNTEALSNFNIPKSTFSFASEETKRTSQALDSYSGISEPTALTLLNSTTHQIINDTGDSSINEPKSVYNNSCDISKKSLNYTAQLFNKMSEDNLFLPPSNNAIPLNEISAHNAQIYSHEVKSSEVLSTKNNSIECIVKELVEQCVYNVVNLPLSKQNMKEEISDERTEEITPNIGNLVEDLKHSIEINHGGDSTSNTFKLEYPEMEKSHSVSTLDNNNVPPMSSTLSMPNPNISMNIANLYDLQCNTDEELLAKTTEMTTSNFENPDFNSLSVKHSTGIEDCDNICIDVSKLEFTAEFENSKSILVIDDNKNLLNNDILSEEPVSVRSLNATNASVPQNNEKTEVLTENPETRLPEIEDIQMKIKQKCMKTNDLKDSLENIFPIEFTKSEARDISDNDNKNTPLPLSINETVENLNSIIPVPDINNVSKSQDNKEEIKTKMLDTHLSELGNIEVNFQKCMEEKNFKDSLEDISKYDSTKTEECVVSINENNEVSSANEMATNLTSTKPILDTNNSLKTGEYKNSSLNDVEVTSNMQDAHLMTKNQTPDCDENNFHNTKNLPYGKEDEKNDDGNLFPSNSVSERSNFTIPIGNLINGNILKCEQEPQASLPVEAETSHFENLNKECMKAHNYDIFDDIGKEFLVKNEESNIGVTGRNPSSSSTTAICNDMIINSSEEKTRNELVDDNLNTESAQLLTDVFLKENCLVDKHPDFPSNGFQSQNILLENALNDLTLDSNLESSSKEDFNENSGSFQFQNLEESGSAEFASCSNDNDISYVDVLKQNIDKLLVQKSALTNICDISRDSIGEVMAFVHSSLAEERSKLIESTLYRKNLTCERDQALEDLRDVERCFTELMERNQKAKSALEQMKQNDILRNQKISMDEEKLKEKTEAYNKLRLDANEELEMKNEELLQIRRDNEAEKAAITAMLRKSEIKVRSLTTTLDQVTKDNNELSGMCEELGYKKS